MLCYVVLNLCSLSAPLQSNKVPVVQHTPHMHPLTPLITYGNEHFSPTSPPAHLSPEILDPKSGTQPLSGISTWDPSHEPSILHSAPLVCESNPPPPPRCLSPGVPRTPHPAELSPYYPLSPGAVGQIHHPLGWLVPQ